MTTETVEYLRSTVLDNERPIWLLPPQEPAHARHLTIFLDGEWYREHVRAAAMIEDLRAQEAIADTWTVFVSMHSMEARWVECPCHPPFAAFLVQELLPWLEAQHPEMKSVRYRTLVGLSYTGLAAAFATAEFPGVFQKVISQSGSFWWNDCRPAGQFAKRERPVPTEFYLSVGTRETQENVRHREDLLQVVSQIDGVRRFRDALLAGGHAVTYAEFDGGHDFESWRKSLPDALLWALGSRTSPGGDDRHFKEPLRKKRIARR